MNFSRIKPDAVNALQITLIWQYVCTLITGILLANSGIPLAVIGIYEMIVLAVHAVSFFWLTGAVKSMMTRVEDADCQGIMHIAAKYQWVLILPAALSTLLIFLLVNLYAPLEEIRPYLTLLLLFVFLYTVSGLPEYILYLCNRKKSLLMYGGVIYSLQVVFVALPFYFGYGLWEALCGLVLIYGVRLLISLVMLAKGKALAMKPSLLKPAMYGMIPFAAYGLLGGVMNYIDGFLVIHFFEPGELAIFRYGARELPVVVILASALSTALIPGYITNPGEAMSDIRQRSYRLMLWFYPVSGVLMLVSYYVFPLMFTEQFRESAAIFNIYLLLITSRLVFPQVMVMAGKHSRVYLPVSVAEVLINLLLSIWWLQLFGLKGLAMATVVAYFFEKAALAGWLYAYKGIPPARYIYLKPWAVFSLLLVAVYIFVEWAIA